MKRSSCSGVAPSSAASLSEAFPQTDAEFWITLQAKYDLAQLRKAKRKKLKPILVEA